MDHHTSAMVFKAFAMALAGLVELTTLLFQMVLSTLVTTICK